ncbi:MAG: hypothetical protein ACYDH5_14825 [Acidimicrobiales bacterium]
MPNAVWGLGEKAVGLARETVGSLVSNDSLRQQGMAQQRQGSERFDAARHEIAADLNRAKAVAAEQRQKLYQDRGAPSRSDGTATGTGPQEALSGTGEKAKGRAKQVGGSLTGDSSLQAEGDEQARKGDLKARAAKEEAKAEASRTKADQAGREAKASSTD